MMKLKDPEYIFCPLCGKSLEIRIEENKKRKCCLNCKWTYYPYVAQSTCAVVVKDNNVLMVKRNREPYRNTWMFPAGFVDYGEHPEDTVTREVYEETGLNVTSCSFIHMYQVDDDPRQMGHFLIVYKVETNPGILKNDEVENKDLRWFPLDSLPEIGWHSHQNIGKRLKNREI